MRGDPGRARYGKVASRTFRTLTEAVRFKGTVAGGEKRVDSRIPFARYAREWVETYQGRKRDPITEETRAGYRLALENYAIPFLGRTPLERIDPPLLKRYLAHLEDQGLTAASVRRYYVPVAALLNTAHDDGLLRYAPNVRIVLRKAPQPTRRQLTPEQALDILRQIPAEHQDLAMLYATTGARLSEPLGLCWRHLDRDDDGVLLRFPRSKTEAGLAEIRLTPEMAQRLTRRRTAADAGPDELIFASATGTQLDGRNWRRRVFKPAAERAGVDWATPHMLRHGVATLMARTGYGPADIGRMLRHADGGRLALRTYVHADAPDVAFLDDVFRTATSHP